MIVLIRSSLPCQGHGTTVGIASAVCSTTVPRIVCTLPPGATEQLCVTVRTACGEGLLVLNHWATEPLRRAQSDLEPSRLIAYPPFLGQTFSSTYPQKTFQRLTKKQGLPGKGSQNHDDGLPRP